MILTAGFLKALEKNTLSFFFGLASCDGKKMKVCFCAVAEKSFLKISCGGKKKFKNEALPVRSKRCRLLSMLCKKCSFKARQFQVSRSPIPLHITLLHAQLRCAYPPEIKEYPLPSCGYLPFRHALHQGEYISFISQKKGYPFGAALVNRCTIFYCTTRLTGSL